MDLSRFDYFRFQAEVEITHYSSSQQILLVGEGDFSFSVALALAFGSANNMVCTSLDSKEKLLSSYGNAHQNLTVLKRLGATVMHNVDATEMEDLAALKTFDRIVYNFPHAGFFGSEDSNRMIRKHVTLVDGFLKCARKILAPGGEIHLTHKVGGCYDKWNITELAIANGLVYAGAEDFNPRVYRGYINRRGAGKKIHDTFRLGRCLTYKYTLRNRDRFCYASTRRSSNSRRMYASLQPASEVHAFVSKKKKQIDETEPFGHTSMSPHLRVTYNPSSKRRRVVEKIGAQPFSYTSHPNTSYYPYGYGFMQHFLFPSRMEP